MYGYTDILSNGNVECIYTGFQQPGGFVTYLNPINAEHIVPQSFFGSAEPMRSDIYILRPCHGSANSSRSNDPYGEVNDNQAQWYGVNGNSYTSTSNQPANSDNWSEGTGSMWEPENPRRATWRVLCSTTTPCTRRRHQHLRMWRFGDLYDWHVNDPPDAAEISRNTKINQAQGNKNPYVENPTWCTSRGCTTAPFPTTTPRGPTSQGRRVRQCGLRQRRQACWRTPPTHAGLRRSPTKTSSMEPVAALEVQALCGPTRHGRLRQRQHIPAIGVCRRGGAGV